MSSLVTPLGSRPIATDAEVSGDRLHVTLADGRELFVPVGWFDWLASATDAQRSQLELIEAGEGIWWEQLGDGVSVPGLLGLPHT